MADFNLKSGQHFAYGTFNGLFFDKSLSVKLASAVKLGTHRARHVVDPKGKMFCARIFIHNKKLARVKKKPGKLWSGAICRQDAIGGRTAFRVNLTPRVSSLLTRQKPRQ